MPAPDTSSLGAQIFLQIILIIINGIFSAAEIAAVSLNDAKIKLRAKEGDKKSLKLLKLVENPADFLSTIQIAVTLSGFLASAFAADNFAGLLVYFVAETCGVSFIPLGALRTASVVTITVFLSYFTMILGELVPKRIAMKKSEEVARALAGAMNFLAAALTPIVWFLSVSTNAVLRLIGINPKDEEEVVSEDEIRMMIDISEEKGAIASAEKEMIENIFEFNNTTAAEIMTHRMDMAVVWLDDSDEDVFNKITESGYSRFPVCGEDIDEIAGVLISRMFLLNMREAAPKPLKELIVPAYFVPMTVRADVLFRNMQAKKCHMAIVVDEYGGTSGLVTMEDLLEEIVGNIYDESDGQAVQNIKKLEDNLWLVSGATPVEELCDELGVEIKSDGEEYSTLGGLIISRLSQIPDDGSQPEVEVDGLRIKVDKISERRIEWAKVSIIKPEEKPNA